MNTFNNRIKQLLLLFIIIFLGFLAIRELTYFLPGLLGALTLYILSREKYFRLVYEKKWKKGLSAILFIVYYLLLIGLPVFLAITLITPKVNTFMKDPSHLLDNISASITAIQDRIGYDLVSENTLSSGLKQVSQFIPTILNSTANVISNLALMLFLLYFMLYHGSELEAVTSRTIPLQKRNIHLLATETKKVVKANALGIPLISIVQGATAALGYFIFGVREWALWGFLTGVFAFFPVVGTMVIWVPLVIFQYAVGNNLQATGLLIYSVLITGNVDYVARITLLKRMGDVHPVITVLGVIIGLNLFGFIGLIFGPLLLSYLVLLYRIYHNEFIESPEELPHERV